MKRISLRVLEKRMLRWIFGSKMEKIPHDECQNLHSALSLCSQINEHVIGRVCNVPEKGEKWIRIA